MLTAMMYTKGVRCLYANDLLLKLINRTQRCYAQWQTGHFPRLLFGGQTLEYNSYMNYCSHIVIKLFKTEVKDQLIIYILHLLTVLVLSFPSMGCSVTAFVKVKYRSVLQHYENFNITISSFEEEFESKIFTSKLL